MLRAKFISVSSVKPIETSHHCRQERVLIEGGDTASAITPIAITTLSKGETSGKHIHPTMEEFFFIRK